MALNAGEVIASFKADVAQMKQGIADVRKETSNLQSNFSKAGTAMATAGKYIATGIGVATAAIGYLGKRGLDVAGDLQMAQNAYTVLLKSEEKAIAALTEIKKDAARTPFDMRELIQANQMLISTGLEVDKSREAVLALGNAIVATGGGQAEFTRMIGNLQQIRNVGVATAMDIRQFGFAGINIYQLLSEATGKSVDKLKDMDITYEMLSGALIKAQKEGGMFAGALDKQAGSWNLVKSNLQDVINITLAGIVTDTGIFKFLNDKLIQLVTWLTDNKQVIVDWVTGVIAKLKEFGAKAAEVFGKVVTYLQPAIEWFKQFFSNIENRKAVIIGVFGTLALFLAAFVISLIAAQITIIAIFTVLAVAIGFFYRAWTENWGHIQEILPAVWTVISTIIMAIVSYIKFLYDGFVSSFNSMVDLIAFFIVAWNQIPAVWQAIVAYWNTFIASIQAGVASFLSLFDGLAVVFSWIWNNLVFPIMYLAAAIIARILFEIYTSFAEIFGWIQNNIVAPVVAWLMARFTQLASFLSVVWQGIKLVASTIWEGIKVAIINPLMSGANEAQSLFEGLKKKLLSIWEGIKSGIAAMGEAIVKAIVDPFQKALKKVEEIAAKIKEAASQISPFHKSSPSLVEYVQMGVGMIKDEYAGLAKSLNSFDFKSPIMAMAEVPTMGGGATINQNINAIVNQPVDVDMLAERLAFNYRNAT